MTLIEAKNKVVAAAVERWLGIDVNSVPEWVTESSLKDLPAAVNEHAADCDLSRMDIEGTWGVPSWVDIKESDVESVVAEVAPELFGLGEEMTTCPKCSSRTDFYTYSADDNKQLHNCLGCGFTFRGEFDDEPEEESEE